MVQSALEIEEARNKELKDEITEALKKIEAKGVWDLTKTNVVEHEIHLIPGTKPIRQKRRPVPPHYINTFKRSIKEMEVQLKRSRFDRSFKITLEFTNPHR